MDTLMWKESNFQDVVCGHGTVSIPGVKMHVRLYIAGGLLIDTGPASLLKHTKKFFRQKKIEQVALTHIHEDHAGAAPWIKENLDVPVYLRSESIEEALQPTHVQLYRRILWWNRGAFQAEIIPGQITAGKYVFDCIDSPGHHPYHTVLHEKNMGWLFSGDIFVRSRPQISYLDENSSDYISTLHKLLKLDFDTLFCGHAGIFTDGKKKLEIKLEHYESIKERVLALSRQGYSVREVAEILYPKKDLWTIVSRGDWSAYHLISTILPCERGRQF